MIKNRVSDKPAYFIWQLLIGIIDVTDQTEEEKKEDAILSQYYLDKFRVDGKSLQVPSRWLLPPKYRLIYHRRCERDYYRYQGFELTVSREKKMHPESPENVNIAVCFWLV